MNTPDKSDIQLMLSSTTEPHPQAHRLLRMIIKSLIRCYGLLNQMKPLKLVGDSSQTRRIS